MGLNMLSCTIQGIEYPLLSWQARLEPDMAAACTEEESARNSALEIHLSQKNTLIPFN